VGLRFYDRIFREMRVLDDTPRPDARVVFSAISEELFPILDRVLPPGLEAMVFVDYTPSRVLRRRESLGMVPARAVPASPILTLHDDNVGVLPQLAAGSISELLGDLKAHGWSGFSTLCGEGWEEVREALEGVEEVTRALELGEMGLGLTFPVPEMMAKHWRPGPFPEELSRDREGYMRVLEVLKKAAGKVKPSGRRFVDYWAGRLEFGIGYLDTIELVMEAASLEEAGRLGEAAEMTERALDSARRALEAYAEVAADRSDLGAIATMGEYVWRWLKRRREELRRKS